MAYIVKPKFPKLRIIRGRDWRPVTETRTDKASTVHRASDLGRGAIRRRAGAVDVVAGHSQTPVGKHIGVWLGGLDRGQRSRNYARNVRASVEKLSAPLAWSVPASIRPNRLAARLGIHARARAGVKESETVSGRDAFKCSPDSSEGAKEQSNDSEGDRPGNYLPCVPAVGGGRDEAYEQEQRPNDARPAADETECNDLPPKGFGRRGFGERCRGEMMMTLGTDCVVIRAEAFADRAVDHGRALYRNAAGILRS